MVVALRRSYIPLSSRTLCHCVVVVVLLLLFETRRNCDVVFASVSLCRPLAAFRPCKSLIIKPLIPDTDEDENDRRDDKRRTAAAVNLVVIVVVFFFTSATMETSIRRGH